MYIARLVMPFSQDTVRAEFTGSIPACQSVLKRSGIMTTIRESCGQDIGTAENGSVSSCQTALVIAKACEEELYEEDVICGTREKLSKVA